MSKLPPLKRLVLEDLPSEVQKWAPKLLEPLNEFMAAVSGGLDRKLTLADNCVAQFRTLTVTIDGDNGGKTEANGTGTAGSLAKWTDADTIGDASAADVLAAVKAVDGSGSGLDADTLDGQHASAFAPLFKPAFTSDVAVAGWTAMGKSSAPQFQADMGANLANTKLALFNNGTFSAGLGFQTDQLRAHLPYASARFSFLDSPSGTEIMTLDGDGDLTATRRLLVPAISGSGSISSSATSTTISNALCSASSVILITPRSRLLNATCFWVVAGSGSFVVNLDVANSAAWAFNYLVLG